MTDVFHLALASAAAAGIVVLVLVGMIVLAKEMIVPSGDIRIVINGDDAHPRTVQAGVTLLSALAGESILLPSACGGRGTCGMCRCQVLEGGGDALPIETNHLNRKQLLAHWRLACQVRVRQDLKLRVPEEIFGIKKWTCRLVGARNVATFIKELVLLLPEGDVLEFEPGSYIQVDVPPSKVDFKDIDVGKEFQQDWDRFGMWSLKMVNDQPVVRAYSMANHPAEGHRIMLNVRIATPPWDRMRNTWMDVNPGVGSSYLFSLKPGDAMTASGPYGDFFIKDTDKEMVYLGGGAGMAPLRAHIFHLFGTLRTRRKVSYWFGGRSLGELFYTEEFRDIEKSFPNFTYHVALSEPLAQDRWAGPTGFIHQVLYDSYLSRHPEPEEVEYYICGPPLMLRASLEMLDGLGVPRENVAFDDFGG